MILLMGADWLELRFVELDEVFACRALSSLELMFFVFGVGSSFPRMPSRIASSMDRPTSK